MANVQEAVDRVSAYLADQLSLEGLEDWSASYIQSIYQMGDAEAQTVAHLIRSILNAYEDDQSDTGLRQELAEAIDPFFVRFAETRYGDPSLFPIPKSNVENVVIDRAVAA